MDRINFSLIEVLDLMSIIDKDAMLKEANVKPAKKGRKPHSFNKGERAQMKRAAAAKKLGAIGAASSGALGREDYVTAARHRHDTYGRKPETATPSSVPTPTRADCEWVAVRTRGKYLRDELDELDRVIVTVDREINSLIAEEAEALQRGWVSAKEGFFEAAILWREECYAAMLRRRENLKKELDELPFWA